MKAREHIALSIGTVDRIATAPDSELEAIRLRALAHEVLARRPCVDVLAPTLLRHRNADILKGLIVR